VISPVDLAGFDAADPQAGLAIQIRLVDTAQAVDLQWRLHGLVPLHVSGHSVTVVAAFDDHVIGFAVVAKTRSTPVGRRESVSVFQWLPWLR
jgi:hypothetical protein